MIPRSRVFFLGEDGELTPVSWAKYLRLYRVK
jgi:hypothetical protein